MPGTSDAWTSGAAAVDHAARWVARAAIVLCLTNVACASDPTAVEEPGLRCALSFGDAHLDDGVEAELLKGYQGYMLVQADAHFWGDVPRSLQLRLSGARDGFDPLVSVVGRRTPEVGPDGHARSVGLEIWLSPPDPDDFAGRTGTLTLEARGGGRECQVSTRVQFVDRTFCVHYDDGSVNCP